MRNIYLILFFGLFFLNGYSQITKPVRSGNDSFYQNDSTSNNIERAVTIDGVTKYTDYKIISVNNDTTIIDTTLTVEKNYKFNYLRKDNFELMAFANQGQTYNKLGYQFKGAEMMPEMGFSAKQYNFYTLNDVKYYYVPTPTSEMMYKKGMQQGQVLNALLTANTSKQLNVSVSYKGLRSLGKYQNVLANGGSFRGTFNYHTKNKRYYVKGHMYGFKIENQENGGLTPESIIYFETNDSNYSNRERLEVNFNDADNNFEGKRYYLDQVVTLFSNRSFEKKSNSSQIKKGKGLNPLNKREHIKKIDSLNNNSSKVAKDSLQLEPIAIDSAIVKKDSIPTSNLTKIANDSLQLEPLVIQSEILKKDSISSTNLSIIDSTAIANPGLDSLAITSKINIPDSTLVNNQDEKSLFNLQLGNKLMYQTKHYRFNQTSANSYFGDAFVSEISDHTSYENFDGELYLQLYSIYTGSLKFKTNYFNYNYNYKSILYYDDTTIGNRLKGDALSIGAEWTKNFGDLQLKADAATILFGDIHGNTIKTAVSYEMDSLFTVQGYAEFTSKTPDFNTQLYQSDYIYFNWQNNFGNEKITTFGGAFKSDKWATIEASYNVIDNYVYFNENSRPEQADETLNYFKVKLIKEFRYRKFALDNSVMYQNVLSGDSFFRVPSWVTRNTIYFSTNVFKGDPLFLQTGITFKYFSSYKMNAYNPLISEFYLQDAEEIGDFPMFDFFFNMRIQRTRFYFQFENISAGFTGRDYYSAPLNPYRDFTFRIGLVWNFFI